MVKEKKEKCFSSLIKNVDTEDSHPIMREINLESEEELIQENNTFSPSVDNISVWPIEENILIERVNYNQNMLIVTILNISSQIIKITSMGVKYTSNMEESIEFQPANIILPQGESTIQIPCPSGSPFKFVLRTENMTGAGCTKDNIHW